MSNVTPVHMQKQWEAALRYIYTTEATESRHVEKLHMPQPGMPAAEMRYKAQTNNAYRGLHVIDQRRMGGGGRGKKRGQERQAWSITM